MFGDVIVPVDGTLMAAKALEVGATLARANDSALRVVAFTRKDDDLLFDLWVNEQVGDIGRDFDLKPDLVIKPLEKFVADGIVAEIEAHPGSLVVMSSHGRNRSASFLGSVADDLMARTTVPIIVCGPESSPGGFELDGRGPIVVALDGTSESEAVVPVAEAWSMVFDLPLEVVTVLDPRPNALAEQAMASGDVTESGYVSSVASHAADVTARVSDFDVLHDKHAADAIVREARARNASLVAMATHASHGLDRLIHGSVTAEVVQHSPVPVLALRPLDSSGNHGTK